MVHRKPLIQLLRNLTMNTLAFYLYFIGPYEDYTTTKEQNSDWAASFAIKHSLLKLSSNIFGF